MKKKFIIFILLSVLCQFPNTANACSCNLTVSAYRERRLNPEMYDINLYPYIFHGKLTEIKTNTNDVNPDIYFGIDPTEYTDVYYNFAIIKQWKGKITSDSVIVHRDLTKWLPTACSVNFELNREYLIYSSGLSAQGSIRFPTAAYCSPTKSMEHAEKELLLLKQIEEQALAKEH